MSCASCAHLYGDEDDVGEDSSQGRVSQYVAGVDDTHDEDDRHAHHKRGKDDGLEQLVSIARQNVNHLDATEGGGTVKGEAAASSLLLRQAVSLFSFPHLSVGNAALHPQGDDLLKRHGAEGALQADRRPHVNGPHQGDEEGFAELCEEQSAGQAGAVGHSGLLGPLDVLQELVDQDGLGRER